MRFRQQKKGEVTLLGMLDMSDAFDNVDHNNLPKYFICRSAFAERLYLLAPSSAKGRKPSTLTKKYQNRRWSRVVFPVQRPKFNSVPALHGGRCTHRRDAWNQLPLI